MERFKYIQKYKLNGNSKGEIYRPLIILTRGCLITNTNTVIQYRSNYVCKSNTERNTNGMVTLMESTLTIVPFRSLTTNTNTDENMGADKDTNTDRNTNGMVTVTDRYIAL